MGTFSSIEWTHHTFNLWWGCTRVSAACDHCYAERQAHHRIPANWIVVGEGRAKPRRTKLGDKRRPEIWGPDAPRIFPSKKSPMLAEPIGWNRVAAAAGERHRVFVSSMCDVFERHRLAEVNEMMRQRRDQFFTTVVPACPALDFLLLTKRPHDVLRLVPPEWRESWPANVWVGTTVEDQQRAEQRLPHLVALPAPVRFISAEPLLGPLRLAPWIAGLDWIIAGGESGTSARRSEIGWVRDLRDQAIAAGSRFFMKQWGNWAQPGGLGESLVHLRSKDSRLFDGRTWDQLPTPRTTHQ